MMKALGSFRGLFLVSIEIEFYNKFICHITIKRFYCISILECKNGPARTLRALARPLVRRHRTRRQVPRAVASNGGRRHVRAARGFRQEPKGLPEPSLQAFVPRL